MTNFCRCGAAITGPFKTCSDCALSDWRHDKQARIDALLEGRRLAREALRKIERALERESDWGD